MMRVLHTQTADGVGSLDLNAGATVLSYTVTDSAALASIDLLVGDGTNDLAVAAETTLTIAVTIGGVPVMGVDATETVQVGRSRVRLPIDLFPIGTGEQVVVTLTSDQVADTDVAVTAVLRDAAGLQPVTRGRQIGTNASGHVERVTLTDTTTTNTDMVAAAPTAAAIADAVWDEATADHATEGSYGASVLIVGVNYTHTNSADSVAKSAMITKAA